MAITYPQSPAIYAQPARRGPIARLLEQKHWLAVALLLPTVVLLGLFIAYPLV
jgi:multiple sugar transport system permease protein